MKIQFEISKDAEQALQSLKRSTGIDTDKRLFNNALSLLDWAVQQVQKGYIVAAVDEAAMEYRGLRMPALEHAAGAESPRNPSASSDSLPPAP